jgi:hypothetical protein
VIREIISFELKSCDITESKRQRERERDVACVGDVVHVERFKGELPQWIEVI